MSKLPSLQFYPGDWLRDRVAGCSLAAQGLWLRLMILAHDSERYGYLCQSGLPIPSEQLARRCGCSLAEFNTLLAELESVGVPSRTQDGVIFSRRMSRDADERSAAAARQAKCRRGHVSQRSHAAVTAASQECHNASSSSSSSSKKTPLPPFSFPSDLDCERFRVAWKRWEKYRIEKDSPIVATEREATLKMLGEMGLERAIDAICYTIAKGWQGLREPDVKTNGKVKHKTDQDAIDYLRNHKEPPCFLGGELHHKFAAVGYDGLTKHEQTIAVSKCKQALEHPR